MPPFRPSSTKILLACASALVGLGAAVAYWRTRAVHSVRLYDDADSVQRLLEQRAADGVARTTSDLVRGPITQDDAQRLWVMPPEEYLFDPLTYYRRRGGQDYFQPWPEHERGGFRVRTSPQGWREDWDELPAPRDFFVVVAGDSHTEGLCSNDESFANLLETRLAAEHAGERIEVLNTGLSGYSFYNYLGVLEKLVGERPDVFVVAVYGGNDFLDLVKPWHFFHATAPPPRSPEYWARMRAARSVSNEGVAMAMNEVLYFQHYPDQVDVALRAARQLTAAIAELCARHRIALVFVYVPPGFEVGGTLPPIVEEARAKLELGDGDMALYDRLADEWLAEIRPLGVPVIDLREHFAGDVGGYYWDDLHIDTKGHARIADLLAPRVEAAREEKRRRRER